MWSLAFEVESRREGGGGARGEGRGGEGRRAAHVRRRRRRWGCCMLHVGVQYVLFLEYFARTYTLESCPLD